MSLRAGLSLGNSSRRVFGPNSRRFDRPSSTVPGYRDQRSAPAGRDAIRPQGVRAAGTAPSRMKTCPCNRSRRAARPASLPFQRGLVDVRFFSPDQEERTQGDGGQHDSNGPGSQPAASGCRCVEWRRELLHRQVRPGFGRAEWRIVGARARPGKRIGDIVGHSTGARASSHSQSPERAQGCCHLGGRLRSGPRAAWPTCDTRSRAASAADRHAGSPAAAVRLAGAAGFSAPATRRETAVGRSAGKTACSRGCRYRPEYRPGEN